MNICVCCKNEDSDLRAGICFECASAGEERAANRTVLQHCRKAVHNVRIWRLDNARIDLKWAWERLTRTGDYSPGGYFDRCGYQWG